MTPTLTLGSWSHIVFTHDGSGNYTCYTNNNGSPITYSGATSNNSSNPFRIGFSSVGGWGYFDGKIDQVRIYNKALSADNVATLYNETVATASTNITLDAPSLVAYYKMSDATDETGSYDGTPTNVNFNVAGKFGNAGDFNGSSSRIATNITNSAIPVNSDFTISTWINTSATSGLIVGEGNWNAWGTAGFAIGMISSNRVELSIANNGGAGGTQIVSSSIPLNTWTNVTATIDIGSSLKLYIDGNLIGTGSAGASFYKFRKLLLSGAYNNGSD